MAQAPTRTRRPGAPPRVRIERTVAAVVFDWDGTAVADRTAPAAAVRERIEELSSLGVHLGIVSGTNLGTVDGQLAARPSGPGALLLALNRGSELFEVSAAGPQLRHRRAETGAVAARLDAAAAAVVAELARTGLVVEVVANRLNRRKIDLIPDPLWREPPKARFAELSAAVTARLRERGIGSIHEVVEMAEEAGLRAGLDRVRVSSDAKHVELGVTDKADSMRQLLRELARRGVGPGLVLVVGDEFGDVGGSPGSDARMLVPEASRSLVLSVGVEPTGVPPGVHHVGGGPATFLALLDEQLRRARRHRVPGLDVDPEWVLTETGIDPARHRVTETLFTLAAGGVGTRGSVEEPLAASRPQISAAGVYRGPAVEDGLLAGPEWTRASIRPAPRQDRRVLDLRTGVLVRDELVEDPGDGVPLRSLRFASIAEPGIVGLRLESEPGRVAADPGVRWLCRRGRSGGIGALTREVADAEAGAGRRVDTVERIVSLVTNDWSAPTRHGARDALEAASARGFDALLADHRAAWARRWDAVDVRIPDDPDNQLALRFALAQLWSLTGSGRELAVGARGLSGSGYSGHVFWDADVFVLPALMTIDPAAATAMVRYRLNRLDPAREYAAAQGRHGARFPWESALTGADVTPASGQVGGEEVAIRTGELEEHITADVAWATVRRATWTRAGGHLRVAESTLLAETARYWASRISTGPDGRGHIDHVIGPDEYHEDVDDNAYTNVMARWNLREAADRCSQTATWVEREAWRRAADSLADGYDETAGRHEQFLGYGALDPLLAADVLDPPYAADVLLGRDRVSRSQLVKQPDVLMMHLLVPQEVPPGSLRRDVDFYAPRTTHGSSLSPAITALLLARAGRSDEALDLLTIALHIDLDDLNGTTADGIHIGAAGGAWQAVLFGFLGADVRDGILHLDPAMPRRWPRFEARFRALGRDVRVAVVDDRVRVASSAPLRVTCAGGPVSVVKPDHTRHWTIGERR